MSGGEANYSFTAKTPAGNLLTVRGDSFEEFKSNIVAARNGNAPAAVKAFEAEVSARAATGHEEAVRTVTETFPGSAVDPGDGWGPSGAPMQTPGGDQELPPQYGGSGAQPPQQYCNHGPMKYIPNGKYGPFWGCTLPKDAPGKCKARSV